MSELIVIDLTENFANVGQEVAFSGEYSLPSDLLPYPNATLEKVVVNFSVTFGDSNVDVAGEISCYVNGFCDRCLDGVSVKINLPFEQTFYKDCAEDNDKYCYSSSMLDATKAVRDEIVLSLPTSLLCSEDCKGLCPKCGQNLNVKQCGCDTDRENPFSALKNLKF